METLPLANDVTVLHDAAEIPGLGVLPVNPFLLKVRQPVLVDTGMAPSCGAMLDALGGLLDPADLRWIWLTHPDRDHTGALYELLWLASVRDAFANRHPRLGHRPARDDHVGAHRPGRSVRGIRCATASRSMSGCAGPRAGPWCTPPPGRTWRGSGCAASCSPKPPAARSPPTPTPAAP